LNKAEILINSLEIENRRLQDIIDHQNGRIFYLEDALATVNIELVKAQKKKEQ